MTLLLPLVIIVGCLVWFPIEATRDAVLRRLALLAVMALALLVLLFDSS
jgi:hypothetical protein